MHHRRVSCNQLFPSVASNWAVFSLSLVSCMLVDLSGAASFVGREVGDGSKESETPPVHSQKKGTDQMRLIGSGGSFCSALLVHSCCTLVRLTPAVGSDSGQQLLGTFSFSVLSLCPFINSMRMHESSVVFLVEPFPRRIHFLFQSYPAFLVSPWECMDFQ